MGPPEFEPPLPEWEFANVPRTHTISSKRLEECNWLQALEGGIDSSHVSWLHRGDVNTDPLFRNDDENCWVWSYEYHPARPLTGEEITAVREGKGIHVQFT